MLSCQATSGKTSIVAEEIAGKTSTIAEELGGSMPTEQSKRTAENELGGSMPTEQSTRTAENFFLSVPPLWKTKSLRIPMMRTTDTGKVWRKL